MIHSKKRRQGEQSMKGKKGKVLFLLALIFSLFLISGSVQAATKKGWVQTGTTIPEELQSAGIR